MTEREATRRRIKEAIKGELWIFTSTEVAEILGEEVARVRGWINQGYLMPSRPAQGRGTKARFSRPDLYQAALLRFLLNRGMDRASGAEITQLLIGLTRNLAKYEITPEFLVVTRRRGEKPEATFTDIGEGFDFGKDIHEIEDAYVINFGQLVEDVHKRVGMYRRDRGK